MTSETWRRIKALFDAARERPLVERASFLDAACGGDTSLRAEVESLLAADTEGFLDTSTSPGYSQLRTALADRYRLERELGRGGMATVFLAYDLKHDRPVALKVLHPELALALGPERFHREIMLAARLQHPHILTVLDSGEAAGQLWFTMPFVEGESLRDRLNREKQLPVEDALQIVREAAEALDYAHRHGVVHRDVKPDNILLTERHALVADFGIARALGGGERLTESGVAIGTPAYMSPEQASGTHEIDARTDVYALGCVLFEMLAGEPPYTGPTPQAIFARALTETPRPIHPMRAGVPNAVDAVIAKAMAVTAADRYGTAAEFVRALEPLSQSSPPGSERGSDGEAPRLAPVPTWLARRPLFAMLALGVLLGGGALFAWRHSHDGGVGTSGSLLAVLPFENLGSPEDEYFADGMTDEVRGKLSTLPGLRVIARGSSTPYKKTAKSPQQIARELGAQYLLTATVRWEKTPGGGSQVHLSPELVEVRDGSVPTTKWQQPFDAALTDVFQVQAAIAARVADALDVALGDSVRQQLAERPTQNLAAYDAFLKGEEVSQSLASTEPQPLRRAAVYYAQAVALDSSFVQAWTQLSTAHSLLYANLAPTPTEGEQARRAAERALALAPNRADGHVAMGNYYRAVAQDNTRAAEEFAQAQKIAPNDASLLNSLAYLEQALGRWEAALAHLQRAQRLDPRSAGIASNLAKVLLWMRRYPEARGAADHALGLAPSNLTSIENKTMIALAQGDLVGARAALAAVPKAVDPAALVADIAVYWDLYWVLDDAQQALVLQLSPSAWDGDRGTWGIVLAQMYWLRGDQARARVYADSARIAFEQTLQAAPQDDQRHVFRGLALAYLGRKAEAIQEGQRGVALLPISKDAYGGAYTQHQLARIYILVGEPEKALDQLEPLLKIPYYLSPGYLRIDPNFDPLRRNPRFQKLVAGGT
jgi:serine/threonine-protein kinase